MIRLDFTQFSTVAVCDLCPWRGIGQDRAHAWHLSAQHEKSCHPELKQAQNAQTKYLSRNNRRCTLSSVTHPREDAHHGTH